MTEFRYKFVVHAGAATSQRFSEFRPQLQILQVLIGQFLCAQQSGLRVLYSQLLPV